MSLETCGSPQHTPERQRWPTSQHMEEVCICMLGIIHYAKY